MQLGLCHQLASLADSAAILPPDPVVDHNQSGPIQISDSKALVLQASWRLRGPQGNQCQNA